MIHRRASSKVAASTHERPARSGMRIAVLVKTNVGAAWIVPQVRTMVERGHEVLVLVADEDGQLEDKVRAVGALCERTTALGSGSLPQVLRAFPGLVRRLRSFGPDVMCSHLYRSTTVARSTAPFVRVPRVHSVPGPLFLESRVIRAAERHLSRLDSVVVATASVVNGMYADLGVPAHRRATVPYGVDLDRHRPPSAARRREARAVLGLGQDERVFVCVAYVYGTKRMVLQGEDIKGHDILLAAWEAHVRSGGAGSLILVGGGFGPAGEARRRDLFARYNSTERLLMVDSVTDVSLYYHAADISIAPSRSENLGSAAEACAFGVPTLASRVGGLPELAIPGRTGWLVDAGSAEQLRRAIDVCARESSEVIEAYGRNARQLAEDILDLKTCAAIYVDIVESVAHTTAAGAAPVID